MIQTARIIGKSLAIIGLIVSVVVIGEIFLGLNFFNLHIIDSLLYLNEKLGIDSIVYNILDFIKQKMRFIYGAYLNIISDINNIFDDILDSGKQKIGYIYGEYKNIISDVNILIDNILDSMKQKIASTNDEHLNEKSDNNSILDNILNFKVSKGNPYDQHLADIKAEIAANEPTNVPDEDENNRLHVNYDRDSSTLINLLDEIPVSELRENIDDLNHEGQQLLDQANTIDSNSSQEEIDSIIDDLDEHLNARSDAETRVAALSIEIHPQLDPDVTDELEEECERIGDLKNNNNNENNNNN